jgi:hypothetical protein
LTYAAHQHTKIAPWNDIINHEAVVSCNDDKSFQAYNLGAGPKQCCYMQKIASERYVFLLSILLIDFIHRDLRDFSPAAFKRKKREDESVKSAPANNFQVRYCVAGRSDNSLRYSSTLFEYFI